MSHDIRTLALSGALAIGASFAAQAAAGGEAYPYRVTDLIVGSVVPQDIITSPLPLDATYAVLTSSQKAVLFADYENLPPGDEPPYPLYGVHHLIKPLVRFAETWPPVGPLVASVEVDSQGNAVGATVYRSPDPQLSRLVNGALMLEKYKPASCHGQPCKMEFVLRLDFPERRLGPVQEIAFHRFDPNTHELTGR